jgi:hypothetical protein
VVGPSEAESEYVGAEERKIKSTVKNCSAKGLKENCTKDYPKIIKKTFK